ncbi:MAG: hypothetical protein AAEJ47_10280, partial [Planctomycetota bacterium]
MRLGILIFSLLFCLFGFSLEVTAQQSLAVSDVSIQGLNPGTLAITMDADQEVEGYVLAITFDGLLVSASDFTPVGVSAQAELVVPEVFPSGVTLGVVMDAEPPFEGNTIPAGIDTIIANLTVTPSTVVTSETVVAIEFSDGVLNSPVLNNILVQGGLSIGSGQGLDLDDGTLTLQEGPPATLIVEDGSAPADGTGSTGAARILVDNNYGPIQGFVTIVAHDVATVTLEAITSGADTDAANAEFTVANLYENGGTFGVVLDFQPPFDGQTIPEGVGVHLASYHYSCNNENLYEDDGSTPPPAAETSPLTLVDGLLGDPVLNNLLVIAGLSVAPDLLNGTFTCEPVAVPAEDTILWMETYFDEGAGNYAYVGQTGDLCFFYKDDDDYIQGFTFTVCYDCDLTIHEDSWEFNGSILDQVGIE